MTSREVIRGSRASIATSATEEMWCIFEREWMAARGVRMPRSGRGRS